LQEIRNRVRPPRGRIKAASCHGRWIVVLIGFSLILSWADKIGAYVMPAEQVLSLMAKNFSAFGGLAVNQYLDYAKPAGPGAPSKRWLREEILWLKTPGFFRVELKEEGFAAASDEEYNTESQSKTEMEDDAAGVERLETLTALNDRAYYKLFLTHNTASLLSLLERMGIELEEVAFDRLDGTICYRLGDKDPKRPKLFVEKERFLPVFLSYRIRGVEKPVRIRFEDYLGVSKGWFPHTIRYSVDDTPLLRINVLQVDPNPAMDVPLAPISLERIQGQDEAVAEDFVPEEKRIEEVIKRLEEKYRRP